ncbi:hypothetical protein [Longimicrobium sp.]|uniref:hypothetical protein n=1 Tax=Longimicrobium sp. TaxID=2029185 RepID=UPI003B3B38C7
MIDSGADGVLRLDAGGLQLALWIDHTFSRGSAANVRTYAREAVVTEDPYSRALGMAVLRDGREIASAVLIVAAWCPDAQESSIIVRSDALYLPAGPHVVALHLPSLETRWVREVEGACIFGMMEIDDADALLVHGELEITRLGMDGEVQWQRGGFDIFTGGCWTRDGVVYAVDWIGAEYRWRLSDGEPVGVTPGAHPPGWAGATD